MAKLSADDFNISDIESLPDLGDCDDVSDFAQTIDMEYLDEMLCQLVNENENTNTYAQVEVEVTQENKRRYLGKRGPDKKKRVVKKGFVRPSTGVNRKPYVMKAPRGPRGPYKIRSKFISKT